MGLRPPQECLALADQVLARMPDGDAEVIVVDTDSQLTRYALNAIHQNVAESSLTLRLRLAHNGRVAVATVRGDAAAAVERLVENAQQAWRLAPVNEGLPPLPAPDGSVDQSTGYRERTARSAPEERADAVATVIRAASDAGLVAFGALAASATQVVIANTRGLRRHARRTAATLTSVMRGDDGAGYADRHDTDIARLDVAGVAAEAVETAQRNQNATPCAPDVYQVVLAPYAVAEMIEHLAYVGLDALSKQEGRSFMREGEQLMSPAVSIGDDATDPDGVPFPFDWEGVTTRTVSCIDAGVCRDVVHDSATALVDGVASTGHALPMPNTQGPMAGHLHLAASDASIEELIAGVDNGLYVTRFWYVRTVHALRTIITGMTREGTFRIKKGRLSTPVNDLRFTQSIVEALAAVNGIGSQRKLQLSADDTAVLAPAMSLQHFAFTS